MDDLKIIIIFFIFMLINIYVVFRIIFRCFKFSSSFTINIIDFLTEKKIGLIEIIEPTINDWKENPFNEKDSPFFTNIYYLTVLKHKIIIADDNDDISVFWLQSRLKLFKKSEINFKESTSKKYKIKLEDSISKNIYIIKDHCPACGEKVTLLAKECLCGLKLI